MRVSDNNQSSESRIMEELYNQMQLSLEEFKEQQERVNVDETAPQMKVKIASIHMSNKALLWHQSFMKNRQNEGWPGWEEYKTAVLARFGMGPFDDPLAELMKLRQNGTIEQYQEAVQVYRLEVIEEEEGTVIEHEEEIRRGRKPDGVCLVVGSCAHGFGNITTSDVIYSTSATRRIGHSDAQLFWEAFPAGSGPMDRTTYMFTYVDPRPRCPTLEDLLEAYWELMPEYQKDSQLHSHPYAGIVFGILCAGIILGVSLDDLKIVRVIFGIFPTYRDSVVCSYAGEY
ncbi:hypothetical protein Cgig2_018837 [Carnegiea gigantea]|uniref:Retrotransposon gag domain-containing protein n=1 Tax=Carnegiea gigantea TaxID=171969 RepID=A0A9Q1KH54_9CARY|nr:hypothetical protein Cgig2_018837 [Carnegiea gigantea]